MTKKREHYCHNEYCTSEARLLAWRKADGSDQLKACGSHFANAVRQLLGGSRVDIVKTKNL